MIKETDKRILDALCCAINGRTVAWGEELTEEEWRELLSTAANHNILPLVADALPCALPEAYEKRAREEILAQARRTAELCSVMDHLRVCGLHPLIVKGAVCRALYPEPEHRPSTDEDLLVDPADFPQVHRALLDYGLQQVKPDEDLRTSFEVSYRDRERYLFVEVHKALFTQEMPYLNRMNACFRGLQDRTVTQRLYGVSIRTLGENDHLLYLLLHALKHFLLSGVGIRQICDIALYSERYRDRINWDRVKRQLTELHALDFARAIYAIAGKYLLPENHMGEYLAGWELADVDAEPMLADIMEGGLYGMSTMTRAHSAPMTLNAAEKQNSGKAHALFRTVFQSRKSLQQRYKYLKKAPYLLPLAWSQRVMRYFLELLRGDRRTNSVLESIRVGSERIRLLKQYHIIRDKE